MPEAIAAVTGISPSFATKTVHELLLEAKDDLPRASKYGMGGGSCLCDGEK